MVIRDRSGKFQTVRPCNCGSTDIGFYYSMHDGEPYQTAVQCEQCRDIGPYAGGQNEEEAARLWNEAIR